MADNNFSPNNDAGQFYKRTNPLANESNAIKMKVDRQYCENLEIVGDLVVNSGAGVVGFTAGAPMSAYDVRYFQILVKDEDGATASNTVTGTALLGAVVVDVSALNANKKWYVTIYLSTDKDLVIDTNCKTFGEVEIAAPSSDPTISLNTILQDAPIIQVYEADGTTAIADGGAAYDLGSYPAGGGVEAQKIVIENAGGMVLKVETAANGGDAGAVSTTLPQYVFVSQKIDLDFSIDTSGGAGAYAGTITLASDDPQNPSFVVNISFTLA